ncbi:C-3 sterol dehydrogenase [Fistulina hepatica ATCC 64428]|uniref:C-3 sterol dehydrogenase n=1 Tax=Fistulina hepatica ATCC 64428 TaxID=1128425 RepID=A0A0D7A843_9AGAR|nr:C-3 sterol dehydrogenase [Fistulina hepatica ATCC 64428]
MAQRDIYFVIGGSGFVGRHIVEQLKERGDVVVVFDMVQRHHDVDFYSGDITDQVQVEDALRKSGATCIIHTASPDHNCRNPALYFKVNVDGTNTVIAAAIAVGVRKLVFTSSAGVVFNGRDLIDVDERTPFPEVPMDAYNDSKSRAEAAVLAANGKNGLLTCALRPASIFGPGDRQAMLGFFDVYQRGLTGFQIGDNTNLFDWTYVGNVARAHLLAADRLSDSPPAPPLTASDDEKLPTEYPPLSDAESAIVSYHLPVVSSTTSAIRVPTSEARPLGPYLVPPPNAERLVREFETPRSPRDSTRPVLRTRFDQLSEYALSRSKLEHPTQPSPLCVAGQVFFITNGEPLYFWDFVRTVWTELDKYFPDKRDPKTVGKYTVLNRPVGMIAATGSEWWAWITGKEATFTRFRVTFSCVNRWHNIEKARRVLGYEPIVGVEEGIQRMVAEFYRQYSNGELPSH